MGKTDKPWREAIIDVLEGRGAAMHYTEIADAITEGGLRENFGATPANTVSSVITTDIGKLGDRSAFVRVRRGEFTLRMHGEAAPSQPLRADARGQEEIEDDEGSPGIVGALGMYWRRDQVHWGANAPLLGQQDKKSEPVDFSGQVGVYLLHDGREVVYVGRSVKRPLGRRLYEHTYDRLNGRWDRFSWFGLLAVSEEGELAESPSLDVSGPVLIATLEAILIEALEPRQNRKRGDDLRAVEYIQAPDPELRRRQLDDTFGELRRLVRDG